jgi:ankyrin repeat protein
LQCRDGVALHGITPLHVAAARGNLVATLRLVHHGADPFLGDKNGNNALDIAHSAGHNTTVSYLIELMKGLEEEDETPDSEEGDEGGDESNDESASSNEWGI